MALTVQNLAPAASVAAFMQDIARPCSGAQARGLWQQCRKDQTLIEVEITAVDLKCGSYPARLVVAQDVSERRRRERESRQIHKMEVIGQVAAGVAHHFNNLLALVEDHADAARLGGLEDTARGQASERDERDQIRLGLCGLLGFERARHLGGLP